MKKLEEKTALITGGTTGIGLATAKLFQLQEAKVAITEKNSNRLNQALEKLEERKKVGEILLVSKFFRLPLMTLSLVFPIKISIIKQVF